MAHVNSPDGVVGENHGSPSPVFVKHTLSTLYLTPQIYQHARDQKHRGPSRTVRVDLFRGQSVKPRCVDPRFL